MRDPLSRTKVFFLCEGLLKIVNMWIELLQMVDQFRFGAFNFGATKLI